MDRRLIVVAAFTLIAVAVALAARSPYLAYRDPIYIIAGFAGIIGLGIMVIQPLMAYRLGITRRLAWHRWLGAAILVCIGVHIGGLFITSPYDTLDALTLASPTPFSVYGVIATAAAIATALLMLARRSLAYSRWRLVHNALAVVIVLSTIIHAVQIEGAMEVASKWLLSAAALAATGYAIWRVHLSRRRAG
ncbi:ferric reductase-like transmembrane domain-containing protein [Paracoccus sp. TK19116]|uniref:Ferric reductase-like transmembrane domain-containing protein n=1 Tax=Paracoccus albicereus TaxID=2922394 RepID=A0ABT1MSE2_9RHOB|nr:ferric reductase-like transmembrane domain-containing protein [Paracoccus albicereus]MCQ0971213.1 ferric reductase-like transmembrane domain-containing protein [Paracoccus albicereus]